MQKYNSRYKTKNIYKLPDAIFLDMDNTLYDYDSCHKKALREAGSYLKEKIKMPLSVFRKKYSIARETTHSRLSGTASSHNRLLYFQHLLEFSGYSTRTDLALRLNDIYWDTFIDNMRIFDGVSEFLKCAKRLSIPTVLITDLTADVQFKKIERLRFQDKFDILVTSEESGTEKPDKEIFKLALKKLRRPAQTVWMIGDSHSRDIAGGKSIGAVTFHKVNGRKNACYKGNPKPDFVFHSFTKLVDILERLQRDGKKNWYK